MNYTYEDEKAECEMAAERMTDLQLQLRLIAERVSSEPARTEILDAATAVREALHNTGRCGVVAMENAIDCQLRGRVDKASSETHEAQALARINRGTFDRLKKARAVLLRERRPAARHVAPVESPCEEKG